jgi:nucleoside-diphosphate-sugar epimerase
MTSLLLTGSTGFIGSAVHRHLAGRPGIRLRLLRRDHAETPLPGEIVHGDLTAATPLPELCTGMDVVVHAASYVGPDPDLCDRVNHAGTARLLQQARRAGVPVFVYVSTAAVYGRGPHSNLPEDAVTPQPQSPVSSSRLAAENLVRAAGGLVVRPHLVYGAGDRWVVPTLARLLPILPAWIGHGTARMSMIRVDDLARLIGELALHPPGNSAGAAYHANHPEPAVVREVGEALRRHLGISRPSATMTYREAVRNPPAGVGQRHLDLLGLDHWYASQLLWTLTGCTPGRPFVQDLSEAAAWYPALARRQLID